jgi:hypothetical protein
MIEWVKILKESPIGWLVEKTNPSVRYFTLRDILDKDENDSQVVAAKKLSPNRKRLIKYCRSKNQRDIGKNQIIPTIPNTSLPICRYERFRETKIMRYIKFCGSLLNF